MLFKYLQAKLDAIAARDQTRALRVAESSTSPVQTVRGLNGVACERLMFCSNDYLGLAAHPRIAEALCEGVQIWGGGSGASHFISGHTLAHERLESKLAQWFESYIPRARTLTFSTGYMANLAVVTALGDSEAEIFSDELNHASLIDGMRLARAKVQRFGHADMSALRRMLMSSSAKVKLIVSDSIFSMDGDIAPLSEILSLAEEFDAWVILDDAHGFGVLGSYGRGALEHFEIHSDRIVLVGTLGKAAGLAGAFVVAHERVIEYVLQVARTYIFSTASLPAVSHALLTSLELIESEVGQARRNHLLILQCQLREGVASLLKRHSHLGWRMIDSLTPVQPLIVGDNASALTLAAQLDRAGLRVPGIRPPTVPVGQARLRITLCATHTVADVCHLLNALECAAGALHSQ